MKPLKKKLSISLDSDVVEIVRQLADEDDRSFSQYVNIVLKEHIQQKNDKKKENPS